MDLTKSVDVFHPGNCKERLHIIGCGSVGSTVAELLTRLGLTNFCLYDFDKVEPHNLANQMFRQDHIGMKKTDAVFNMMQEINPDIAGTTKLFEEGYKDQRLSGYVFLCVDNIDLRREIAEKHKYNPQIIAMFDFRTRLFDAQHYAADWTDSEMKKDFLKSMAFSHDEAMEETPVSACNVALSVAPTVRVICSMGVANFMHFVNKDRSQFKKMILADPFNYVLDVF